MRKKNTKKKKKTSGATGEFNDICSNGRMKENSIICELNKLLFDCEKNLLSFIGQQMTSENKTSIDDQSI